VYVVWIQDGWSFGKPVEGGKFIESLLQ